MPHFQAGDFFMCYGSEYVLWPLDLHIQPSYIKPLAELTMCQSGSWSSDDLVLKLQRLKRKQLKPVASCEKLRDTAEGTTLPGSLLALTDL